MFFFLYLVWRGALLILFHTMKRKVIPCLAVKKICRQNSKGQIVIWEGDILHWSISAGIFLEQPVRMRGRWRKPAFLLTSGGWKEGKASKIKSITTSHSLILNSLHEHGDCDPSPLNILSEPKVQPQPTPRYLWTPSSFHNLHQPGRPMQGCLGEGRSSCRLGCMSRVKKKTKQNKTKQGDEGEMEGYTLILPGNPSADRPALDWMATGSWRKWTAAVGWAQPQHARRDKELSAPPRPPSTDPCHPKALSSSNPAGAKANFPLWLSRGRALWNYTETDSLRAVPQALTDWCIQGRVVAEDASLVITETNWVIGETG